MNKTRFLLVVLAMLYAVSGPGDASEPAILELPEPALPVTSSYNTGLISIDNKAYRLPATTEVKMAGSERTMLPEQLRPGMKVKITLSDDKAPANLPPVIEEITVYAD